MPHQDGVHLRKNLQAIEGLIQGLVSENVAAFARHGNATLDAGWLAAVALICFGWTDGPLHDRVQNACSAIGRVWNVSTTVTRQGLLKALASCGQALVERTVDQFPQMLAAFRGQWTRGGKVNIAVDGTKLSAPRTADNQAAFSAAHSSRRKRRHTSRANASKAATVQLLATVFWHLGTGLPLRWKLAGSTGSERQSVVELLDQLPANARLIGDAEYVGYPLWSAMFLAKQALDAAGITPRRMSAAKVLRACLLTIQGIVLDGRDTPRLTALLIAGVVADESARTSSKASRRYPRKKKHEPCGPPKIKSATRQQQQAAKEFLN